MDDQSAKRFEAARKESEMVRNPTAQPECASEASMSGVMAYMRAEHTELTIAASTRRVVVLEGAGSPKKRSTDKQCVTYLEILFAKIGGARRAAHR